MERGRRGAGRLGLPALCCALAALSVAGCRIRPPIVHLQGIALDRLSLREADLVLQFEVTNPNAFGARLKELHYALAGEGETLAHGKLISPIPEIPAWETRTLEAPLRVELSRVPRVAKAAWKQRRFPYVLTTDAVFDVLGISVPKRTRREGALPSLEPPKWRLCRPKVHLSSPHLELVFEVTNPTDFDLSLTGLTGHFSYGGQALIRVSKPDVEVLPAGKTVRFSVPVEVHGIRAVRSLLKAAGGGWDEMAFDGELQFEAPPGVRRQLERSRGEGGE